MGTRIIKYTILAINILLLINNVLLYVIGKMGFNNYNWMQFNYGFIRPYEVVIYLCSLLIVFLKVDISLKRWTVIIAILNIILNYFIFFSSTDIY